MKPISTFAHGILDWLTSTTCWSLPRVMGWSEEVRNMHTAVGCSMATYSLFTNYELGLVRAIPMPAHLALDAIEGAACLAAPLMLCKKDRTPGVIASFLGVGALELAAAFLTRTQPAFERREQRAPAIRGINQPIPSSIPTGSPGMSASGLCSGETLNENLIDDVAPQTAGSRVGAGIE